MFSHFWGSFLFLIYDFAHDPLQILLAFFNSYNISFLILNAFPEFYKNETWTAGSGQ